MADDTPGNTSTRKPAPRRSSSSKPKASTPKTESHGGASHSGSSDRSVWGAISAILDHVTGHGSEKDDALSAQIHELSKGKAGRPVKGTTDENSPVAQ